MSWNTKTLGQHLADGTYRSDRHGPVMHACEECGQAWLGLQRRFCSKECRATHYYRTVAAFKRRIKKHRLICQQCGGAFFADTKRRKFCNRECVNAFRRQPRNPNCAKS